MKHFLKTLLMFVGMIVIGLLGVFLISYFDGGKDAGTTTSNVSGIAN